MPLFEPQSSGFSNPYTYSGGASIQGGTLVTVPSIGSAVNVVAFFNGGGNFAVSVSDSNGAAMTNNSGGTLGIAGSAYVNGLFIFNDTSPQFASSAMFSVSARSGTLAALPSAPVKYLIVEDNSGSFVKIPCYNP